MPIDSYPPRALRLHHRIIAVETPADWTDVSEVQSGARQTILRDLRLCNAIHHAKIPPIQRAGLIETRRKDGRRQIRRGPRWEEVLGAWHRSRQVTLAEADIAEIGEEFERLCRHA